MIITFITIILYATVSYALNSQQSGTSGSFGDFRPAIFFPAIIAILYGPIVGGLSAGLGNLLYDALRHQPISQGSSPLDYGNLFGAIGNTIGGMIVGGLSKPYRNTQTMFDYSDEVPDKLMEVYDTDYIRRLIRNTIAAIVGLAFVNAFIIGYGQRLTPGYDPSNSQPFFISVSSNNGLVLLVTTPLTLVTITFFEWVNGKKSKEKLRERRKFSITNPVPSNFEIISAMSPKGDEVKQQSWGAVEMIIRNTGTTAKRFFVRMVSDDIFSPHRHKTPALEPGQEDAMYFNIYAIANGKKSGTLVVQEDVETAEEHFVKVGYEVPSSYELIIDKLMNLSLVIGFLISIVLVAVNIRRSFRFDSSVKVALIALPLEILIVLGIYILQNWKVTKSIMKFIGSGGQSTSQLTIASHVDSNTPDSKVRRIHRFRVLSKFILFISIPLFVILFAGLISSSKDYYQVGNQDILLYGCGFLLLLLLLSELFLESADFSEAEILDKQALRLKVVRSAISSNALVKFESTEMVIELFNPFTTKGMRIFLHSIDNISPRSIILDSEPGEIKPVHFTYTPLEEGNREVGLEFVQYRNFEGKIIPTESAETFDQETLRLKVSDTRLFGLAPEQLNILKNAVAGISSVIIALSFIARYFNYKIDPSTLQATLPLIILLQSPVIYMVLFFQNKLSRTFSSNE